MQSIISATLFVAEQIDYKGDVDTAMDYTSRASYLLDHIKNLAQSKEGGLTSESILETTDHIEDIQFMNAYAHYCMLMPQFYKKTFKVIKLGEKKFKLDFTSEEVQKAEVIDRIYSGFAQQMVFTYAKSDKFCEYLDYTIQEGRGQRILNDDFIWIKDMYSHFYTYSLTIEVVPSKILEESCGFNYEQYRKFCASVRAYAEYYKELGRSYKRIITDDMPLDEQSFNMNEYINWTVPSLKHEAIGMIQGLTDLTEVVFLKILSYYTFIFEDNTGQSYEMNAVSGEAYTPPFMLLDNLFIQSPHCMKYMLPLNNVLYSMNKLNSDLFNNEFSKHLEPTLINQLLYIFSCLGNVRCEANVNYSKSEIDLLVLSEKEKVCLNIQVKTTIAPDSARTVRNVESRSIEGVEQLSLFLAETNEEKMNVINSAFNTALDEVKIISLLVVRSSAGSGKAWKKNEEFKIINYPLLAALINGKIEKNELNIGKFDEEIFSLQEELLLQSKFEIIEETLEIEGYEISFPNISFNSDNILGLNLKTMKHLPDFEKATP
ncbi:MAG: hypothetical protein ACJASQ_002686 [Crocinitomicaceae bacterium]|jgi:hypothetical protein